MFEDTDVKATEGGQEQVEESSEDHLPLMEDQEPLEEHCPSTPVVILTPLPPLENKESVEYLPTTNMNKEKTERHCTIRECTKKLRKSKGNLSQQDLSFLDRSIDLKLNFIELLLL